MTTDNDKPLIFAKILAIQKAVGPIAKDGMNQAQKYPFRRIEKVLECLHPLLVEHGVFVVPLVIGEPTVTQAKNTKGGLRTDVTATVEYRFYAEDGSYITARPLGQGMATDDKAGNKAMTSAQKNALCHVFSIPYSEPDPDEESLEIENGNGSKAMQEAQAFLNEQPAQAPQDPVYAAAKEIAKAQINYDLSRSAYESIKRPLLMLSKATGPDSAIKWLRDWAVFTEEIAADGEPYATIHAKEGAPA